VDGVQNHLNSCLLAQHSILHVGGVTLLPYKLTRQTVLLLPWVSNKPIQKPVHFDIEVRTYSHAMRPQWRWHRLIVGLAAFTSALFLLADFTELVPYILCAKGLRKYCSSHTKVVVHSSWVRPERQQPVLPAAAAAAAAAAVEAQPHSSLAPNWSFTGVQQCVAEGDPDACTWCNSTFTVRYPLMAEHFQHAFIPGQPCSMPPGVLQRLQSNQSITIAVIGGSMTAGHGCFDQRHGSQCAWPAKLQHRLQEMYPNASITVKNLARPGFSYTDVLSSGHIHTALNADVLLIDLQVNSQVSCKQAV